MHLHRCLASAVVYRQQWWQCGSATPTICKKPNPTSFPDCEKKSKLKSDAVILKLVGLLIAQSCNVKIHIHTTCLKCTKKIVLDFLFPTFTCCFSVHVGWLDVYQDLVLTFMLHDFKQQMGNINSLPPHPPSTHSPNEKKILFTRNSLNQ